MFRSFQLSLLLLSCTALFAQERTRELTLRDAVTYGSGSLRPQGRNDLQWIPGSEQLSYIQKNALMRTGLDKKADEQLLGIAQLNQHLKDTEHVKQFPSITWLTPTRFHFEAGDRWHTYDMASKTMTHSLNVPAGAERWDFDPTHKCMAYTEGENLHIIGQDPFGSLPISTDGTDGLVYGRSVHREEYGITKGTFWDPTGAKLAFYRMDESMVSKYQLEHINTQPSNFSAIRYPMAGQASHHVTVGIYDVAASTTVYLKSAGAPDDYLTNIAWTPDGNYISVIHLDRATRNMRVALYDGVSGELVRTLLEEHDDKWLEPVHPVTFLKERRGEFLHFSPRDGWQHLYLYGDNGLIRQVTRGNWVVQRIIGFDAKEKFAFVEGTDIIDAKAPKGALERHIYRVDLDKGISIRLTKAPGVHSGELSSSGTRLIDTWSSLTVPRRTEIIDAAKGMVVKTLLDSPDPWATLKVGNVELLTIPGENGAVLNARIIKPMGFDPKVKYPVIVYLYNGPHAQMLMNDHLGGAQPWMLQAAERGYIVFTVDGHGTDNRGRDFEQVIHRQLGLTEVKDQLHGVAYLKSLPYVDSDRMGVHGWSFGGHVTTALMLRAPQAFKIGIAGGPVMDWAMYEVMYTERYMDTPEENPEGYAATKLTDQCGKLEGKLLVIHGQIDDVVLPEHSYTFLQDCIGNGEQVEFFVYPGHPHNVRGKDRVHLMTKVLDRFDQELLVR